LLLETGWRGKHHTLVLHSQSDCDRGVMTDRSKAAEKASHGQLLLSSVVFCCRLILRR
jgi:hypothetical protein